MKIEKLTVRDAQAQYIKDPYILEGILREKGFYGTQRFRFPDEECFVSSW
jgi:hypothetical protein